MTPNLNPNLRSVKTPFLEIGPLGLKIYKIAFLWFHTIRLVTTSSIVSDGFTFTARKPSLQNWANNILGLNYRNLHVERVKLYNVKEAIELNLITAWLTQFFWPNFFPLKG